MSQDDADFRDGYWLTTQEAARRLGVKPATLYAYVSRGLLSSRRAARGRGSEFRRDDIARLATRSRTRARRQSADGVVQTALTELEDGQLRYRGLDAPALAVSHTFEEVAELLWTGELLDTRPWHSHRPAVEAAQRVIAQLPAETPTLERLRVACSIAAAVDPLGAATDPLSVRATGRALISTLVDSLPSRGGSGVARSGSIAERLWDKLTPQPAHAMGLQLLDAALVLLADHELAASTVPARAAASARCDPYAVVECGLAAASGSLHGRSSLAVERMLSDLQDGRGDQIIARRLRERGRLPGFGHKVHHTRDPRADTLIALVRAAVGDAPLRELDALLAAVEGRDVGPPNVDLGLATLTTALGMPIGSAEAIFGVARCAGWLAHAFEQYEHGDLIRARAIYVGQVPEAARPRSSAARG